jgi:hypothetical protein
MTYEKPEVFQLGEAEEVIQGSFVKNMLSDHNGTGLSTSVEVDD